MTTEQAYETIIVEKERGRARITLNRPEKLNALSRQLQSELAAALRDADNDTRVHCVILRGAGRAFSAGYDLTPERRLEGESGAEPDQYAEVYRSSQSFDDDTFRMEEAQRDRMTIFDMHKPVIGQLHGYCIAGGTDLILLSDIVVAAEDAQIGFPPVRAMGGPPAHMWTYLVGPQWAKYMLLTGDFISGAQAQEIGLVWRAVPAEQLEESVEELADKMAMIHPTSSPGTSGRRTWRWSSWALAPCSAWRRIWTLACTPRRAWTTGEAATASRASRPRWSGATGASAAPRLAGRGKRSSGQRVQGTSGAPDGGARPEPVAG